MTISNDVIARVPESIFAYRRRLTFVINQIKQWELISGRSPRVLDVGCGSGILLTIPVASYGYEVLGIDIHEESIQYANKLNPYKNLKFEIIEVEQLASASEEYDIIICSEVLEHLAHPERLLNNLRELISEDGIVIITIPNGFGPKEIEDFIYRRFQRLSNYLIQKSNMRNLRDLLNIKNNLPTIHEEKIVEGFNREGHVNFFTKRSFTRLVNSCGLEIVIHENRRIIGGKITAKIFDKSNRLVEFNSKFAGRMPTMIASSWMFVLRSIRGS